MLSPKDRLERIKKGVKGQREDTGIVTSIYYLIKELKCLPDIVGREYEVEYDDNKIKFKVIYHQYKWYKPWTWNRISEISKMGQIKKICQLPIKIPTMKILFEEMKKDYIKQEKEAKKMKKERRRR